MSDICADQAPPVVAPDPGAFIEGREERMLNIVRRGALAPAALLI
jgi:hypothetical protein